MRRTLPALLLLLCALLLLGASSPPYRKGSIEIALAEEAPIRVTLRTPVSHAMRADRAGGYLALYDRLVKDYDPRSALNYLAIGLGDYLSAECERRRIDPLDATLEWTKDLASPFIYYEERTGREIDLAAAGREIARAMDSMDTQEGARAHVCMSEVPAQVTVRDLRAWTREMGRYSTDFATSGANRRHNLLLAATAISGNVIEPSATFSFNAAVGDRTAERGFREAKVVVNGEFVRGVGGGVCQVSTTLYNAVLLADLPVLNAAAHSRPVSYVPYSRDCTVSSAIDFRFTNDTAHPVYLLATVKGSRLTFVLYGDSKEGTRRLESEIVEEIPSRAIYQDGSPVANVREAILLSEGRAGVRSRLYLVREEGEQHTRTLIRENLYPPKDAIYRSSDKDGGEKKIA